MGFESDGKKHALTACEGSWSDFKEAGGCFHLIPRRDRPAHSGEQDNCVNLFRHVSLNQRADSTRGY